MAGLGGYGSAYTQATQQGDEDSALMLARIESTSPEDLRYLPDGLPSPPREPGRVSSPAPAMGFSVFGNETAPDRAYQEQVAWANSTQFRTAPPTEAKPQMVQTSPFSPEDETPPPSRKYFRDPRHMLEPWTTGIWIRFPWWGFGALFIILLLTGTSASILLASDGTSLEDWKIGRDNAQPHVYISVFEIMMNLLILFALADGVVIRFWRQLLHGTTLDSLHDTYDSVHVWPALKRVVRLRFNMVAVACILASLSFARGPLFQRALTIMENDWKAIGGAVDFNIASQPLLQLFQSNESSPLKQGDVTPIFSDLLNQLIGDNPLPYKQPDSCGDYCTGSVKAYTLKATCEKTTRKIDLDSFLEECGSCTTDKCSSDCQIRRQAGLNATFFSISYKQADDSLTLQSVYKNRASCIGDIQVHTCTLTHAMGDVPIVMTNDTVDIRLDAPISRNYDENVSVDDSLMKTYWPLAFDALFPSVAVNITASSDFSKLERTKCIHPLDPASSTVCSNSTTNSLLFPNDPSIHYAGKYDTKADEDPLCGLTWNDPMPDMIRKMQSLTFRTTVAMAAAPDSLFAPSLTGSALADVRSSWTQNVPVTGYRTKALYHASPLLVALGVAISVIGVVAIVPLYYGFWEIGRKVSLDPLEIARAFGAPMMEGLDGNTTPGMITVERGGMSVKYGAVDRAGVEKKLRVEESGRVTVRTPWQGEIFG